MMYERRPWGWFVKLLDIRVFWIKVIWVSKGEHTSTQRHWLRSEFHIGFMENWRWSGWSGIHALSWRLVPQRKWHALGRGCYIELAWGRVREEDIDRRYDKYGRT